MAGPIRTRLQAAAPCAYALSPASGSVGAEYATDRALLYSGDGGLQLDGDRAARRG